MRPGATWAEKVGREGYEMTTPRPIRWRQFVPKAVFAILTTMVILPIALGWGLISALTRSPCTSAVAPERLDADVQAITIRFRSRAGLTHDGIYIPSENGAVVIIAPPLGGSAPTSIPTAELLARHGYGVLLYDARCCADPSSLITLGRGEADDLVDAMSVLEDRPEVDPDRIGALGFSSAGAAVIMAAAAEPRLRAIVVEGSYRRLVDALYNDMWFTALMRAGTWLSYRLDTGYTLDDVSPMDVIGEIAPRPILLIYGSEESALPQGRSLLELAGENAELWVVPGAHHGDYLSVAPDEFESRVIGFLDRALLGTD